MHHHNQDHSSAKTWACCATAGEHAWYLNIPFSSSQVETRGKGLKTLHIGIHPRERDLICPMDTAAAHADISKLSSI